MGSRYELEVKVVSAKDLKNVNWKNGDLRPYAVIWVESSTKASTKTAVVGDGDNPPYTFDESITLALPGPDRRSAVDDAVLSIDLVHAEASDGVKPLIGSGRLSLGDVGVGGGASTKTIKLKRPSGRPQGKVEVKVTVREMPRYYDYSSPPYGVPYGQLPQGGTRDVGGPNYPYGAPPPGGYPYGAPPPSGYPYGGAPPPGGYPYGAPPAGGYAYGAPPPPQAGYPYSAPPAPQGTSYGTAVVEEKKKGKFGAGTGLAVGAAAGLLGGLALVGGVDYIAEKAAEKVESGPGFDDDYDPDYDDDY